MIYRQAKVNEVECCYIEFGTGDIMVTSCLMEEKPTLFMKNWTPGAINRNECPDVDILELKPECMIRFTKRESLDVVIHHLMKMRNNWPEE